MKFFTTCLVLALLLCGTAFAETLSGDGVTVHFDPADAAVAQRSLDYLREAVVEFESSLPLGDAPVTVYVAHTMAEFHARAGSLGSLDVSGIARPYRGEIVVKAPHLRMTGGDYRGTLRHELLHILLFRNSNTDVMPRWFNEGLCMMLANEYRWTSTLTVAKMFVQNRIISYRLLDRAFRAPESGMQFGDAYAQGLSMTRYLRDQVGEEAFWALIYGLREDGFADALARHTNLTVTALWQGYSRSLWRVAIIGTLSSGSLFGPAAILVIVAWFSKRRKNQRILDRWAREEEEAMPEDLFTWDAVVDDPDAWKSGRTEDDSDPEL